jgi:hypothetical protein
MITEQQHPAQIAGQWLSRGVYPLPLPARSKAPVLNDWPNLRLSLDQLSTAFQPDSNVGAILGTDSNNIADVDMDWPEAGMLFDTFLPQSWLYGRKDNGELHARHLMLHCADIKKHAFDAPASVANGKKRRIVEILSTGQQVVVPGSIHQETGEPIVWIKSWDDIELAEISNRDLYRAVRELAGAALLARIWPDLEGSRHDVLMALTGAMVHADWTRDRILPVLFRIVQVGQDREANDRKKAIASTLLRAADGKAITGLPSLSNHIDPDVMQCLVDWWRLGQPAQEITYGGKTAEQVTASSGVPQGPGYQAWPELLEFEAEEELQSPVPYPVNKLGGVMSDAVHALVAMQQVPPALAVQSVLATATTAIQPRYDVLRGSKRIPLSLWLTLIAKPGERKTTTDDLVLEVLWDAMKEARKAYVIRLDTWKKICKDKENTAEPGPRPRSPVWFMQDTTTEGLMKSLDINWPALTLTNSDAAAWVSGYSMRDNRDSATAAVMSQIWSGSPFTSMRASKDEPTELHGRRLALSLMLQPSLAAELFSSKILSGQGFLSRCLPAFPASTIGTRFYAEHSADERLVRYQDRIRALLMIKIPMDPITGDLTPATIALDAGAMQHWIKAHDRYEAGLAGEYRSIEEVANKAGEQVLRLAGIQAIIEGSDTVRCVDIDNSIVLMDWYLQQWLTLTARLKRHQRDIAEPLQLWEWMIKRRLERREDSWTLKTMYKTGPRLIRNDAPKARKLVTELLRRGYVRQDGNNYQMRPDDEL